MTLGPLFRHGVFGVVAGGFCLCFFLVPAIAAFAAGPAYAGAMTARRAAAPACATPARTPLRPCICTREYKPVCGRTPEGGTFTYANPCMAGCAGAIVIRPGRC